MEEYVVRHSCLNEQGYIINAPNIEAAIKEYNQVKNKTYKLIGDMPPKDTLDYLWIFKRIDKRHSEIRPGKAYYAK